MHGLSTKTEHRRVQTGPHVDVPPTISFGAAHGRTARGISRRDFLLICLDTAVLACSGCHTGPQKTVTLPARHSVRADQLLVLSDFKLPKNHMLIDDLDLLRRQAAQSLDLPLRREQVVVYLFSSELEYKQYLHATYPKLPHRRAYFVGTPQELAVYTFWGDRIQEDLRHEFIHGLLHSCYKNVPLWLDEGLAEYFEVAGPVPGEVNREYAHRLTAALANGWRPDIERLEGLDKFAQMQRTDYQEAWAWMHFMLHSSPESKEVLLTYLRDLRSDPQPTALSTRLEQQFPDFKNRFTSYLASLHASGVQVGSL